MATFPILMVSLYICIFVIGILLLIKVLPSYRRLEIFWLILFIIAVCIVSFCSLNVYVASSFEDKVNFSRWRYVGHGIIAQTWVLFLLTTFSKSPFLRNPLLVMPIVILMLMTVGIAIVPELSPWLVHGYTPFHWQGVDLVRFKNGPWFTVHIIMAYLSAVVGLGYVAVKSVLSKGAKRSQLIVLSMGGLFPAYRAPGGR